MLKAPKGMKDFGPDDVRMRDYIISTTKRYFELYGGQPIDTPVMERLDLVKGLYGEEFDKLVYKLDDQGGEKLLMRYDLTVPFARYVTMNSIEKFKRYQVGKVYRRDDPQMGNGRYREFYQADFDIIGDGSSVQDVEMLLLLVDILKDILRLGTFEVMVNDRSVLYDVLLSVGVSNSDFGTVCSSLDKMDKMTLLEVVNELNKKGLPSEVVNKLTNYITLVQSFEGGGMSVIDRLKIFLERGYITDVTFNKIKDLFDSISLVGLGDHVVFNPLLSRGLDYYTGIIYEAVYLDKTVMGSSIAAGGRYDSMLKKLGHRDTTAIGLSLGVERLVTILEKNGVVFKGVCGKVYVATIGKGLEMDKLVLVNEIRRMGVKVDYKYKGNVQMKKHIEYVLDNGIQYMIILGGSELESGTLKVRYMSDNIDERKEEVIRRELLYEFIKSKII